MGNRPNHRLLAAEYDSCKRGELPIVRGMQADKGSPNSSLARGPSQEDTLRVMSQPGTGDLRVALPRGRIPWSDNRFQRGRENGHSSAPGVGQATSAW